MLTEGSFCLKVILSIKRKKVKKNCRKLTCEKETHIWPKKRKKFFLASQEFYV